MAFTPNNGYSDKRASTVFSDGENNQRADFTYILDSNWTTEKFSEDQSSLVFTNGENKQRATVVYNIGNSSGGGSGSGDVTSVNGKTGAVTLTGNDISSTITGTDSGTAVTDTVTNHLQTLKNDQEANGTQIHEIEAKIPQSATETNQLATKEDLPDSKTGTIGQVYTKTDTGGEWQDASGGSSLPDQTGNAGKFLTTDGTNTSWGDALTNKGLEPLDLVIGQNASAVGEQEGATAIGQHAVSKSKGTSVGSRASAGSRGVAIGGEAVATGVYSTAIGLSATASADYAVQIGVGNYGAVVENTEANTCKFGNRNGNYTIVNADGFIPSERLASDGTTGQVLSKTDTGMEWKTVSGGGSSADNNGLEGDYCSKYGIVDETASGLPTQGTGNQIIIPAQLVMNVPGVSGLTTNASAITHDLVSTTNCEIFLSEGTVIEATDVFFQMDEPADGTTGYAAWWNGTEWKFKSNDTGNVWHAANAVRIAKCIFTDGTLTRLCFTGCRVLDKQEWLPKNGITTTGTEFSYVIKTKNGEFTCKCDSYVGSSWGWGIGANFLKYGFGSVGTNGGKQTTGARLFKTGGLYDFYIGTQWEPLNGLYTKTINGGAANAAITVPTTSGTMVVATPPTTAGNYVLKATVAEDGTVTTQWVAEA